MIRLLFPVIAKLRRPARTNHKKKRDSVFSMCILKCSKFKIGAKHCNHELKAHLCKTSCQTIYTQKTCQLVFLKKKYFYYFKLCLVLWLPENCNFNLFRTTFIFSAMKRNTGDFRFSVKKTGKILIGREPLKVRDFAIQRLIRY